MENSYPFQTTYYQGMMPTEFKSSQLNKATYIGA